MDDERLRISYIRKVASQLQLINHSASLFSIAFDAEREDTAESVGSEKLFGTRMRFMGGETWI